MPEANVQRDDQGLESENRAEGDAVVFRVPEDEYRRLEELAKKQGMNVTELIQEALALQNWIVERRREGSRILIEREGRVREVVPAVPA